MSLSDYAGLKAEIADYLDNADLTSNIDSFIDLCEARMQRTLRIRGMIERATASLSTNSTTGRFLALPTGYLAMRILRLTSTSPITMLKYVNEDELTRRWQTSSGKPAYYTIHEEIEFDRVPDSAYTAEMVFYAKFTPLSSATGETTNTVLTNHPDLYLFGSLLEAEPFLDNDERIAVWQNKYDQALADANMADRKSRPAGQISTSVAGATP